MTGQDIALGIVAGFCLLFGAFMVVDGLRDRRRRNLALQYRDAYRDGWRDCRDGHPPKDFS